MGDSPILASQSESDLPTVRLGLAGFFAVTHHLVGRVAHLEAENARLRAEASRDRTDLMDRFMGSACGPVEPQMTATPAFDAKTDSPVWNEIEGLDSYSRTIERSRAQDRLPVNDRHAQQVSDEVMAEMAEMQREIERLQASQVGSRKSEFGTEDTGHRTPDS